MIGGIGSQVGFSEEKTDLLALRPPPDKGFDRVLERASQARTSASESSKAASTARHATQRRALFEERGAEARPSEPDQSAAKKSNADKPGEDDGARAAPKDNPSEESARTPSAEGREGVQSRAPAEVPSEEEQPAVFADGMILDDAYIDPDQAGRALQAVNLSGLGLVTYQQSPHGKTEAEAAANAGLTLSAPVQGAGSAQPGAAEQTVEAGDLLKRAKAEEQLPAKTAREQIPELVKLAKPEELPEQALEQLEAKPEAKGDAGRLALLNAMRQPPPAGHPALASAFGAESGAGLKEAKLKGEGGESARTLFQVMPRGAEAAQATVPNIAAPDRGSFAILQRAETGANPTMERVTQEVRWMIRNDRSEATIRLEPDHLGTMRIKVVQSEGTLRVEMTVDNQLARNLIESRLGDLQQRLSQHDTGAEQFSFNVNVQDQGGGWESFKQAAHSARAMPYTPSAPQQGSLEPAMTAAVSRPIWGHSGVGVYA